MDSWETALNFDGVTSFISLTRSLPAMPAGITIEFWALGANNLPSYNSIFETHTTAGKRLLNIHLPWINEIVIWDAGPEGPPLERIEKHAQTAEYKGKWTHWAFIKDVARGEMAILCNGEPWHKETGRPKPIPESNLTCIGSSIDPNHKWSGRLAEFRIWDRPRTVEEVRADRGRRLSGREPNLIACWPLGRIDADGTTPDLVGGRPGKVQGAAIVDDVALSPAVLKARGPEASIAPGVETKSGLVLDLKLDAIVDGKVLDVSGSGNHAAVTGSVKVVDDPILGPCLDFPGGVDFLTIRDPFRHDAAFSICLWVKPALLDDGGFHGIIGKLGDGGRSPSIWVAPGKGGFHYDSFDPTLADRKGNILDNFFKTAGEWVHICWVKGGTDYWINRDGALFVHQPAPEHIYSAKSGYQIGRIDNSFVGKIGRVRIYDRTISPEELTRMIADDRAAGLRANTKPAPASANPTGAQLTTVTPIIASAPTGNPQGPALMKPENSAPMKSNADAMKTVLEGATAGLADGQRAGAAATAGSDLTKVGYNGGYALSYGFLNGLLDGVRAASAKVEPPKTDEPAHPTVSAQAKAAAIKVRSNTGVPESFLQRDLLVCCGEDREEMLHAIRTVLPGEVPSYRYRCYEFWRYPSFTLVLTGIGTGCLEPMLWEVMDAKTLGDKAARRLVLFGTAGYLSDDKSGCGKVFLVDGAYPAGCAVRLDPADLPVRPRFHGLDQLPNPRAEEISTDHYYAFSPGTDPHKMVAKKYDKSLQEGVTAQWKNGRLIAMETGQFYHFCRCYGDAETQFAAFRGVANLADQFEQQGDNAVNVLRESFRQAIQLLTV